MIFHANPGVIDLGVNIDHVATLRNARGTVYPDPIQAALQAEEAGADLITLHLREDRRHIRDADVHALRPKLATRMNLECAITSEMLDIACRIKPQDVCLVPEKARRGDDRGRPRCGRPFRTGQRRLPPAGGRRYPRVAVH